MTEEMRSRVLGTILGSVSRGQFPHREPVAFLYGHVAKEGETPTHTINGVGYVGAVAPDIYKVYTPELQKTHPYAYVADNKLYGIMLNLFSEAQYYAYSGVGMPSGSFKTYRWIEGNKEWDFFKEGEDSTYTFYESNTSFLWTSHDILHKDSTEVYLAHSDPIPIYE